MYSGVTNIHTYHSQLPLAHMFALLPLSTMLASILCWHQYSAPKPTVSKLIGSATGQSKSSTDTRRYKWCSKHVMISSHPGHVAHAVSNSGCPCIASLTSKMPPCTKCPLENFGALLFRNLLTPSAAPWPSAMAHTTRDCPLRQSPAANTPSMDVANCPYSAYTTTAHFQLTVQH